VLALSAHVHREGGTGALLDGAARSKPATVTRAVIERGGRVGDHGRGSLAPGTCEGKWAKPTEAIVHLGATLRGIGASVVFVLLVLLLLRCGGLTCA
jgi:hypothetical protein